MESKTENFPSVSAVGAKETGLTLMPLFTVSQLSDSLKRVVENNFSHIKLRGEISGYRGPHHSSGHAYFTLKDDKAKIDAVIWRGVFSRLPFHPEEGMEVIVSGKVTIYQGSSKYQIVIDHLEVAGAGALMALLEARKKKLAAEGLFDEARKKALPFLPQIIGVVTSPNGAVIRDILHRLQERMGCKVILWPASMQGQNSAEEVKAAIQGFNAIKAGHGITAPDVVIIARGGGSLEDLWPFNDEALARTAAASNIPIISAIGHETDWTLLDYVADKRAPTPSAAAEMVVPVLQDLVNIVQISQKRLRQAVFNFLSSHMEKLQLRRLPPSSYLFDIWGEYLKNRSQKFFVSFETLLKNKTSMLDQLGQRLHPRLIERASDKAAVLLQERYKSFLSAMSFLWDKKISTLEHNGRLLENLSYKKVLQRGFALVLDKKRGLIASAQEAQQRKPAVVVFQDGEINFPD